MTTEAPRARSAFLTSMLGAIVGVALVFGALYAYRWLTTPNPIHLGDYSQVLGKIGSPAPTILVRPGCPACARAEQWLKEQSLTPNVIVSTTDPAKAEEIFRAVDVKVVPILVLNDRAIAGFHEEAWRTALKH